MKVEGPQQCGRGRSSWPLGSINWCTYSGSCKRIRMVKQRDSNGRPCPGPCSSRTEGAYALLNFGAFFKALVNNVERSGPTSALHDVINGPVIDSSIAGFNIQKRLIAHSHRHHLLHTDFYTNKHIKIQIATTEIQKLGQ